MKTSYFGLDRDSSINRSSAGIRRHKVGYATRTAEEEDRIKNLKQEFSAIDADGNRMLTLQELFDFLGSKMKNGQTYDKQMLQALFQKMDRNQDGTVSSDEFILAYVDAEQFIKKRIKELQDTQRENTKTLQETQKKLAQARNTEVLNEYNIMVDSALTVNVVEAQNLKPMDFNGSSDPYCILTCEKQKIETRYLNKTLNPVWNEAFTFKITRGDDPLKIVVMDHDTVGRDEFEGQIEIPLELLSDQMKHDQFFDLLGETSQPWQGRIHLVLQWIWSRVKYLESVCEQWEETIKLDEEELANLQYQLESLQSPFGLVTKFETWMPKEEKKSQISVLLDGKTIDKTEEQIVGAAEVYLNAYLEGKNIEWNKIEIFINLIFLCICTLSMFTRPDFVNYTLCLLPILFFIIETQDAREYRLVCGGLLISELYDLIWFFVYAYHWLAGERRDEGIENDARRFSTLVSFINFIWKLIMIIMCMKHSRDLKKLADSQSPQSQFQTSKSPMRAHQDVSPIKVQARPI